MLLFLLLLLCLHSLGLPLSFNIVVVVAAVVVAVVFLADDVVLVELALVLKIYV